MKIVSSGFAKVGNTSVAPLTNLHVEGSGASAGIRFDRLDASAVGILGSPGGNPQFRFVRSGTEYSFGNRVGRFHIQPFSSISSTQTGMFLDASGQVGIGVLVPSHALDVAGTTRNTSGSWISGSDRRLKADIKEYTGGLDEILKINPITFNYNGSGGIKATDKPIVGVVAQEFQKVAPYAVSTFKHVEYKTTKSATGIESEVPVKEEEFLQVDNGPIKYMLVNAIKEQQSMIQAQAERIAQLEEAISSFGSVDQFNSTNVTLTGFDLAELNQNRPNPFNGQTSIDYIIPTDSKSAKITIFGSNGQILKTLDIEHVGKGTLEVSADDLPSGSYSYQLTIDGRSVETRKMIHNK